VLSGFARASDYQYSRSLAPSNDQPLVFNTTTGAMDDPPTSFEIPTPNGRIVGSVHTFSQTVQVFMELTGSDSRLTTTYGPSAESMDITLIFSGIGSMEYTIAASGDVTLVGHDISDCALLAQDPLYLAITDARRMFLDAYYLYPNDTSSTDYPVSLIYLMLNNAAMLPDLVEDCTAHLQDPLYGVCVVHENYQACMDCCDQSVGLGRIFFGGCTKFVAWPWKTACVVFLAPHNCATTTCTGKPGDPSPTSCTCADQSEGVCMWGHCPTTNACGTCGSALYSCCPL